MIWNFKNILARRLFLWSVLSTLVGLGMVIFGDGFWQSFGIQALAWGICDAGLAWVALKRTETHLGTDSTREAEETEAGKTRRKLWVSTAASVIFAAGGAAMATFWGRNSLFWQGTGWGIIFQSAFQYIFNLRHAFSVPEPLELPHLPLFTHPDHEPFLFKGGKPAAVLVHGFPGTALEMRPIGQSLADTGWTVRGVRLPGFGPDLADVIKYRNTDWIAAIQEEFKALRQAGHSPLLLVGFSFGGALALQVAAREALAGLVLIAPLTWREPPWGKVLLDFARSLLPLSIYPFRYVQADNPMMKEEFLQYLPEITLENPEHTSELRHLRIPLYILDQIREVGREALATASMVHTPTLLIQGTQDIVIHLNMSGYLRDHISGPVTFENVEGPHSLTMPNNPAFDAVTAKVTAFAAQFLSSKPQEH